VAALDSAAIALAYKKHGAQVLRRARKILGDDAESHEVLQEIFTSLLHRPEQFQGKSTMTTWLYSATTHACLNRLRNRKRRAKLIDRQVKPQLQTSEPARAEERLAAREILARVSEDLAQVAVYYYFDQMTHAEIAEVLGCSDRQVGNLLGRFLEAARRQERVA
jgi:RNA polymerase sigma-70 factor (ECF subfamily)